ncbi:MAG: hypothetical protein AB1941_01405 [Gemmatimonadota bacterium]
MSDTPGELLAPDGAARRRPHTASSAQGAGRTAAQLAVEEAARQAREFLDSIAEAERLASHAHAQDEAVARLESTTASLQGVRAVLRATEPALHARLAPVYGFTGAGGAVDTLTARVDLIGVESAVAQLRTSPELFAPLAPGAARGTPAHAAAVEAARGHFAARQDLQNAIRSARTALGIPQETGPLHGRLDDVAEGLRALAAERQHDTRIAASRAWDEVRARPLRDPALTAAVLSRPAAEREELARRLPRLAEFVPGLVPSSDRPRPDGLAR